MVGVVEGGVAGDVPDGVHACLFDARAILGVSRVVWEGGGPRCLVFAMNPDARGHALACEVSLRQVKLTIFHGPSTGQCPWTVFRLLRLVTRGSVYLSY